MLITVTAALAAAQAAPQAAPPADPHAGHQMTAAPKAEGGMKCCDKMGTDECCCAKMKAGAKAAEGAAAAGHQHR